MQRKVAPLRQVLQQSTLSTVHRLYTSVVITILSPSPMPESFSTNRPLESIQPSELMLMSQAPHPQPVMGSQIGHMVQLLAIRTLTRCPPWRMVWQLLTSLRVTPGPALDMLRGGEGGGALALLSEHQEPTHTQADEPSPGTPLGAPGDRLQKSRQAYLDSALVSGVDCVVNSVCDGLRPVAVATTAMSTLLSGKKAGLHIVKLITLTCTTCILYCRINTTFPWHPSQNTSV